MKPSRDEEASLRHLSALARGVLAVPYFICPPAIKIESGSPLWSASPSYFTVIVYTAPYVTLQPTLERKCEMLARSTLLVGFAHVRPEEKRYLAEDND